MPCSHKCPSPKPVIYEMISLQCLVGFQMLLMGSWVISDQAGAPGTSLRLRTSNTGGTGSIHGLGTKIPFAWQCGQKIQKRKKKRQPQRAAKNKINTAVKKKKTGVLQEKGMEPSPSVCSPFIFCILLGFSIRQIKFHFKKRLHFLGKFL